jgi:hypothetical protein
MQYDRFMLDDALSPTSIQRQATEQFRRLHQQAVWYSLWSALTGRHYNLLSLYDVQKHPDQVQERSYIGLRPVPIAQILGSEGRSADFDADFRPLKTYNRDRWIRVATARNQDVMLPAVQLMQVDNHYFVRDGHHRISVAKMMGQLEIEAEVTVWRGASLPEPRNEHTTKPTAASGARPGDKHPGSRFGAVDQWLVALRERFRTGATPDRCTPAMQCNQSLVRSTYL